MNFGVNVFDFGAKGDGVTDDTFAIQQAINYVAKKGGGRILFPYTQGGYRIASPAIEEYNGRIVRAQLVIPPEYKANIYLEGEMPCRFLNSYTIRPVGGEFPITKFGSMRNDNTRIFSDWDAPEIHDPTQCPYSIIAAPEGDSCAGHFSATQISVANLEFRVPLRQDKMYPTQSCANFQYVSRVRIVDCQFCLNEQVGDTLLNKELQENPCHTVGLMMSGDQNDHNVIRSVAVQGFKYGLVLGEHVVADYIYVHNCEEGIVFHDASHISCIEHVVAQHNRCILTTSRGKLFGHKPGPCLVTVGSVSYESGAGRKPAVNQLRYGVYDPDHRLHGSLVWRYQTWGPMQEFPIECGEKFKVKMY